MRILLSQLSLISSLIVISYTYFMYNSIGEKQLAVYLLLFVFGFCFNEFLKNKIIKVACVVVYSIVYSLLSFIEFVHAHLFNSKITVSTISIFLETNASEAGEFLHTYINGIHLTVAFLLVSALIITFVFWLKQSSYTLFTKKLVVNKNILILSLLVILLAGVFVLRKQFLPFQIAKTVENYQYQKSIIESVNVTPEGSFEDVTSPATSDKEVYVLVIGESTTRSHMSLYGYSRETNPLLAQRKEQLLIYKDVIAPHTHTIPALGKALTLGNYEDPTDKYNSTIIQLFNKAGFKTYWVSNQRPVGVYETSTKIISRNSAVSIYTDVSEGAFDGKVIDPLIHVLKEEHPKKLVVIHLMGTHFAYNNRYPEDFTIFSDEPETLFKNKKAFQAINEYDNAVLYNDYVVNEIISEVEKTNSKSVVLYLSDHGEEVYETLNKNGHTETNGSKPMYDIPFILWRSKKFLETSEDLTVELDRPYSSEDLPYSLANLAGIKFKRYVKEKSIFNAEFTIKDRMILNNKPYEEIFKKE